MTAARTPYARFFRSVPGRKVSRYGTELLTPSGYRAAQVVGSGDHECVIAISQAEAAKYTREYNRAVNEESLIEVEEKDYLAWLDLCDRREKEAAVVREKAQQAEASLATDLTAARAANPPKN